MKIKVIASGSKGNCTALIFDEAIILLDAGIGFKQMQKALEYRTPAAALITHEHGDHAKCDTLEKLIRYGLDVHMTAGTAAALQFDEIHRIHTIKAGAFFEVENLRVLPVKAYHDAREPVNFIISGEGERIWYITDTGIYNPLFEMTPPPTKILIEANYNERKLALTTEIDAAQRKRIFANHSSFQNARDFLRHINHSALTEIHLIHISKRFGDKVTFRQILADTFNIPVFAH